MKFPRIAAEGVNFLQIWLRRVEFPPFFWISGLKIKIFSARAFGARVCLVSNWGGGATKKCSFVSASFWRVLKTSPVSALCDPKHFDKIPILFQNTRNAQNFFLVPTNLASATREKTRACVCVRHSERIWKHHYFPALQPCMSIPERPRLFLETHSKFSRSRLRRSRMPFL